MSVLGDIEQMFDMRGCTGLTVWVDHNKHIQVSTRGPDGESWNCHTHPDLDVAMEKATGEYLKVNSVKRPRIPKKLPPKRDNSDLI